MKIDRIESSLNILIMLNNENKNTLNLNVCTWQQHPKCVPFESSQQWIKLRIVLMFIWAYTTSKKCIWFKSTYLPSLRCLLNVYDFYVNTLHNIHSLQCLKCWYVPMLPKNAYGSYMPLVQKQTKNCVIFIVCTVYDS